VWPGAHLPGRRPHPVLPLPGSRLLTSTKLSKAVEGQEGSQGPVLAPWGSLHHLPPTLGPGFADAGHNMIFLEEVDPSRFLIFCIHNHWHGKETVVVNLLSKCLPPPANRTQRGARRPQGCRGDRNVVRC